MDIPLREVTHGVATHYHMDHAGAAQDLKHAGMRLVVAEEQVAAIPLMARFMKPAAGRRRRSSTRGDGKASDSAHSTECGSTSARLKAASRPT